VTGRSCGLVIRGPHDVTQMSANSSESWLRPRITVTTVTTTVVRGQYARLIAVHICDALYAVICMNPMKIICGYYIYSKVCGKVVPLVN
jgi:hypothetical protein